MARFPFKPGAGAKAIRNPIYWNRLYLQETGSSRAKSRPNRKSDPHLCVLARFMNINTNLNFAMCAWLKPLADWGVGLTPEEGKRFGNALAKAISARDDLYESPEKMTQRDLGDFAGKVRRFILIVLELAQKYGDFAHDDNPVIDFKYDAKTKEFLIETADGNVMRRYFLGQPDVSQLEEIERLFDKSNKMVSQDF